MAWPRKGKRDESGRVTLLSREKVLFFSLKRFGIKLISFLLLGALLFSSVMNISELLYPSSDNFRNWQALYAQEKNSIDVLIVGSSHAYSSFDIDIFDETLGEKSFILASNSQTVMQSYYNIKEVLKYQKPETIILEAFSIDDNNWRSDFYERNWRKDSNIDGMRLGLVKLEAIAAQYTMQDWPYAFLRIARSHQNWTDTAQIIANLEFVIYQKDTYNGFRPSQSEMTEEIMQRFADMERDDTPFAICEENIEHFHKLAELCRENNIRLVLVMAPMYDGYTQKVNYASQYEAICRLAESENLEYIDCNMSYDEIGLTAQDFENIFSDIIHMNAQGAAKVSGYVAERIKE